jgi:hypothetical protein
MEDRKKQIKTIESLMKQWEMSRQRPRKFDNEEMVLARKRESRKEIARENLDLLPQE